MHRILKNSHTTRNVKMYLVTVLTDLRFKKGTFPISLCFWQGRGGRVVEGGPGLVIQLCVKKRLRVSCIKYSIKSAFLKIYILKGEL